MTRKMARSREYTPPGKTLFLHACRVGAACLAMAVLPPSVSADNGSVQVELAPYIWLAGIDGDVTVDGRSASFDQSFSDLVHKLDAGAMGLGSIRYKRLVVFGQFDYIELSSDADLTADIRPDPLPIGIEMDGEVDTTIATVGLGWHFDIFEKHELDLLLGARRLGLDVKLKHQGDSVSETQNITDAIVILSPTFHLSDKWLFKPILSYGIGGDSDTTYELQPQMHYRLSPSLTLGVAYRRLHYEASSGQRNTVSYKEFDGDISGMLIGVAWRFGAG
jgi:hypothetical protein